MKLLLALAVLGTSFSAQANYYNYFCRNTDSGQDQILKILISNTPKSVLVSRVKADTHEEGFVFKAKYDPKYKPRGHAELVRFIGKESEGSYFQGSRHAILSVDLLKGAHKGFMQIRGDEDGYWSQSFSCTFKSVSTK